jgi:hypothetical protein
MRIQPQKNFARVTATLLMLPTVSANIVCR